MASLTWPSSSPDHPPLLTILLTWSYSSPDQPPHLSSPITCSASSPDQPHHLTSFLTWSASSPDQPPHLSSPLTWSASSPDQPPHLTSLLTWPSLACQLKASPSPPPPLLRLSHPVAIDLTAVRKTFSRLRYCRQQALWKWARMLHGDIYLESAAAPPPLCSPFPLNC